MDLLKRETAPNLEQYDFAQGRGSQVSGPPVSWLIAVIFPFKGWSQS